MWNASTAGVSGYYGHQPQQQQQQQPPSQQPPQQQQQQQSSSSSSSSSSGAPRHDVFVGNLAFATTEEQLHVAFSELGRVVRVRMVSDVETGKPRGFAFVEFEDPQAALSAIRNMNDYEINGRKLRVNFSNSSHLETLASQLGMDLSNAGGGGGNKTTTNNNDDGSAPMGGMMMMGGAGQQVPIGGASTVGGGGGMMMTTTTTTTMDGSSAHTLAGGGVGGVAGSRAVAQALGGMNKGEMYDVVARLKEIADANPDEARRLLTQHPQLPEAILFCMSEVSFGPVTLSLSSMFPHPPSPPPHTHTSMPLIGRSFGRPPLAPRRGSISTLSYRIPLSLPTMCFPPTTTSTTTMASTTIA
jgi:cleavage stimulation factor subunit 2